MVGYERMKKEELIATIESLDWREDFNQKKHRFAVNKVKKMYELFFEKMLKFASNDKWIIDSKDVHRGKLYLRIHKDILFDRYLKGRMIMKLPEELWVKKTSKYVEFDVNINEKKITNIILSDRDGEQYNTFHTQSWSCTGNYYALTDANKDISPENLEAVAEKVIDVITVINPESYNNVSDMADADLRSLRVEVEALIADKSVDEVIDEDYDGEIGYSVSEEDHHE